MKAKALYLTLALGIAGWAGVAAAVEARGPIWDDVGGKVGHTTYYYCNGDYHGALDISNGTCSVWSMRGMLVGTYYWNVVTGYSNCVNSPQTAANYTYVAGSSGYIFYQYHHNHNANSYSRSCDRCALGLVGATGNAYGAHVHGQSNQNSTKLTAWYSGYATCGTKSNGNTVMGYPRLS
jgi:hypothetical protein